MILHWLWLCLDDCCLYIYNRLWFLYLVLRGELDCLSIQPLVLSGASHVDRCVDLCLKYVLVNFRLCVFTKFSRWYPLLFVFPLPYLPMLSWYIFFSLADPVLALKSPAIISSYPRCQTYFYN